MRDDLLICVSGPSGVGKGTLVRELVGSDDSLVLSVSCTTRAPRKGEREGVEYFFVSRETFEEGIRRDDFIEYDEHFGNYYGTPRSYVKAQRARHKCVILEIDVVGALKVKHDFGADGGVVTVMIAPPSREALEARLKKRGSETEEQLALRRERVAYELSLCEKYDHVIVNDDFDEALGELRAVINKEKNRN